MTAVPGAPAPPTVTDIRATSCVVRWSPPDKDGGAPVTCYTVERRTGPRWIQMKVKPTGCELEVTDLYEDEKYEFRVIAENREGPGKPSEPSAQITPRRTRGVSGRFKTGLEK